MSDRPAGRDLGPFLIAAMATVIVAALAMPYPWSLGPTVAAVWLIVLLPARSPPIRAWCQAKAQDLRRGGIGLATVSMLMMIPVAVLSRMASDGIWSRLTLLGTTLGIGIFAIGKTVRLYEQLPTKAQQAAIVGDLSGPTARRALGTLWRERLALIRLAGPWFAVFCLAPLAMGGWDGKAFVHAVGAVGGLFILLVGLLAWLLIPLMVASHWSRYLLTGRLPRLIALPDSTLWSFTWRLAVVLNVAGIVSAAGAWVEKNVGHVLGPLAHPAGVAVSSLLIFLVVMGQSASALSLPAIAAGDRRRGAELWLRVAPIRFRYFGGLLLLVAPMIIAATALWNGARLVTGNPLGDFAANSAFIACLALLFATVLALMTYLSEMYAWVRDRAA